VHHDKSRYLELVQPHILKIEGDADLEDGSQIEADISPGARPLIGPHTELDELADPAHECGWYDRIYHPKRSSEGVPKRPHCLATLIAVVDVRPRHRN